MDCFDAEVLEQYAREELPDEEAGRVRAHLDGCAACSGRHRALLDAAGAGEASAGTPRLDARFASGADTGPEAAGPLFPEGTLARGTSIGRFLALEKLGQGGMGEVYAAFDPQLNRRIAVKLMLSEDADGQAGRERMLREAQAMAQLSHPNVLPVYEAGEHEGRIFIAMELVEGQTLRRWLKADTHRPWRAALQPFLEAGEGLAAAHRAGLIHRDFKPDNVMLSKDGRVYVMDFGLARAGGELAEGDSGSLSGGAASGEVSGGVLSGEHSLPRVGTLAGTRTRLLNTRLTLHKGAVGTPGYMPPEQIRNEELDARADVFAFAASLYLGLYGQKPFTGGSAREVLDATLAGKLRAPSRDAKVPAWLHRVVLKGLSDNREARWASMDAMLAALRDDPAVRRRRYALGAAALVALAAAVALPRVSATRRAAACEAEGAAFAQAVWSSERRAAVEKSFRATGVPYVETTLRSVTAALDAYAQRGQALGTQACLATRVRGEAPVAEYALKAGCLQQRQAEASALLDVFAQADRKLVERAVVAASKLPAIDTCADTDALLRQVKPPQNPQVAAQAAEVREVLVRARAQSITGRYAQALALLEPLAARSAALGYQPLQAEVLETLGRVQWNSAQQKEATRTLRAALVAAEASNHDTLKLAAADSLIFYMADDQAQGDAARDMCNWAFALASRLPRDDRALGDLHGHCGWIDIRQGRPAAAEPAMRRALELAIASGGPDSVSAIVARNALGAALIEQRKLEEAQRLYAELLPQVARTLGEGHPWLATMTSNLAVLEEKRGLHAQALATGERARDLFERAGLSGHPNAFRTLLGIAKQQHALGREAEALAQTRAALEAGERALGEDNLELAGPLLLQAEVLLALGRPAEVLPPLERVAALVRKVPGEASLGPARAADGVRGELLLAQGRAREAVSLLQASLAHLELPATAAAPWDIGHTRFLLARAQVAAGLPREAAVTLASRALEELAGEGGAPERPTVEAWLRQHGAVHAAAR